MQPILSIVLPAIDSSGLPIVEQAAYRTAIKEAISLHDKNAEIRDLIDTVRGRMSGNVGEFFATPTFVVFEVKGGAFKDYPYNIMYQRNEKWVLSSRVYDTMTEAIIQAIVEPRLGINSQATELIMRMITQ